MVKILQVDFRGKVLIGSAAVKVFEPQIEEEAKLVEMIMSNANTLLSALDKVGKASAHHPEEAEEGYDTVKKIVAAQHTVALEVTLGKLMELMR